MKRKKKIARKKDEDPEQLNDGVWTFAVRTTPANKTGYVWARTTSGTHYETFVSASSSALMFETDTDLVRTSQTFSNRDAFLSWACQQLGGGTLNVWDTTMTSQTATHSCS